MPMYNTPGIVNNLKEAVSAMKKVTPNYEIILINDGSTTNCYEEAKKFKNKKVRVVGYSKNQGKGYAIKYGFNFATGDYISFVDSGGELNPGQLKGFMEIMDKEKADVVVGSKKHPLSEVHYPLFRRVMSGVYQILNKILFNLYVKDTQVGIKLFKRDVLEKVMPKIVIKRFAFDLEFLVVANKYNFKIVEAPIVMHYKFGSTINPEAIFWMLWDTAAIFYRLKILRSYD